MPVELSVCIVAYNNYIDTKAAITSIEHYTSPLLTKRIYIVDNGVAISNPSDVEDFKTFIEKFTDIEYIDSGKNLGFGKGHNQVIPFLNSSYHAIINPDILLCEDSFSKIVEWMNINKEVGMSIPLLVDESGNQLQSYRKELTVFDLFNRYYLKNFFKRKAKYHNMQDKDFSKPFQVPFAQGSFLVIRTQLFKDLNGFDENFFLYVEDADLCKRVNQVSKLMYYPGTKVTHKWRKGSHEDKALFKQHLSSIKYYFKKYGLKLI